MGKVTFHQSVSLDGYSAGPNQSLETPLGVGGKDLHTWAIEDAVWREQHELEGGQRSPSSVVLEEITENVGAYIMGRNMFGGGPGPWGAEPWTGWWGENPPFHTKVFVLTHFPREPLILEGGNAFHFITEGPERALELARYEAGVKEIAIAGGAQTIQQYWRFGAVDEFWLHLAPIFLGGGSRFFERGAGGSLRQVRVVEGNAVTHIKYEVIR